LIAQFKTIQADTVNVRGRRSLYDSDTHQSCFRTIS
jgi:hypothetical protein